MTSNLPKGAREYLSEIGRKGGGSTSIKKRLAVQNNIALARAKRWPVSNEQDASKEKSSIKLP